MTAIPPLAATTIAVSSSVEPRLGRWIVSLMTAFEKCPFDHTRLDTTR